RPRRTRFAGHGLRVAMVAASVAGALACLDPTEPVAPSPVALTGYWVVHVSGGPLDPYIGIVHIRETGNETEPLRFESLPTRAWDGSSAPELFSQAMVDPLPDPRGQFRWSLNLTAGIAARLEVGFRGDTIRGGLRVSGAVRDTIYPVVGFRISPLILPDSTVSSTTAGGTPFDSTPLVLLRVDDN